MPDPFTTGLAIAAAGGAAGEVTKEAFALGRNLVNKYFGDQKPEAIEKAKENTTEFLIALATRIDQIEREMESREGEHDLSDSLRDPDAAASFEAAVHAAGRTSNAEKHQILARSVADRLGAEADSLRALATNIAISAVPNLTVTQLNLMGFIVLSHSIRPTWIDEKGIPEDAKAEGLRTWLRNAFCHYEGLKPGALDLWHLDSVSLITFRPGFGKNFAKSFGDDDQRKGALAEFFESDLGKNVEELWTSGIQSVELTPAGTLVGVYVHDGKTGGTTSILGPLAEA